MSEPSLPPIEYPTLYVFRVVAHHAADAAQTIRRHVESVLGPLADENVTTSPSSAGRYVSVRVTCFLTSEEQRVDVYARLKGDTRVILVL